MTTIIKKILRWLPVTAVALLAACATDDGNYTYLSDEEAGIIEFDTVQTPYKSVFYRKFNVGDTISYDRNVIYAHPERLRYRWFTVKTNYNSYQPEQVGNTMVYPPADTIARTRKLDYVVTLQPGTYFIYLMAEDSVTGMKKYINPAGSYLVVNQQGKQGGLYLLSEKNGKTTIEVFTSNLMLIYGAQQCFYDYYHQLTGTYLEGKPRFIRGTTTGSTTKNGYLVATDKNLYRLNSVGLQTMNEWGDMFYNTPETFDPQASWFTNNCDFLINNGKLHVLYANKTNDRKFSDPVAGDYSAATFLMKNTRTTWRPVTGAINAWQVVYDTKSRRFRPYFSQGSQLSAFKTTSATAPVDANAVPGTVRAVFQGGGNYTCVVTDVDGKPYLYRYNFYNVVDSGNLAASGTRSVIDLSGCTDIQNARLFASNTAGYAFYYATANAVYSFSASSGASTGNTIYTCLPGEEVTAIYAWGSAGGGWPTSSCCLWVAVWDSNKQEGKLIQYEVDVNYGVATSVFGPMFGAPDNPVITTGWGRIVDMTCIDAE